MLLPLILGVCTLLPALCTPAAFSAPFTQAKEQSGTRPPGNFGPNARYISVQGMVVDEQGNPLSGAILAPSWFTLPKNGRGRGRAGSGPQGPLGLTSPQTPLITGAEGKFLGIVIARGFPLRLISFGPDGKTGGNVVVAQETERPIRIVLQPLVRVTAKARSEEGGKLAYAAFRVQDYALFQTSDDEMVMLLLPGKHEVEVSGPTVQTKILTIDVPQDAPTLDLGTITLPKVAEAAQGKPVTPFRAKTMSGASIEFPKSYRGKLVLLDFWATWCVPCLNEALNLAETYKTFSGQGFEILGVTLDHANATDKILSTAKTTGMTWDHVYDGKGWNAEVANLYGIRGIPAAFLVDGDTGEIIATGDDLRGAKLRETVAKALRRKFSRGR